MGSRGAGLLEFIPLVVPIPIALDRRRLIERPLCPTESISHTLFDNLNRPSHGEGAGVNRSRRTFHVTHSVAPQP